MLGNKKSNWGRCAGIGRWFAMSLLAAMLVACGSDDDSSTPAIPEGKQVTFAVIATSDLHTNVLSYDYYKTVADPTLGLERTATLITKARSEYPNHVLLDNGDTIQGTVLSDYQATVAPIKCEDTLAQYKVMNYLKYDVGTIGNHEFNYGLPFLNQVTHNGNNCKGPNFPLVLANVYRVSDGKTLFPPYTILSREFDGVTVKIGVIGFTPPPIMQWDKKHLEGQVTVQGVKESAEQWVPQLRKEGADVVIALVHGGLSNAAYTSTMENAAYYAAQVPGIDALIMGHSHSYFPDGKNYANMANVDNVKGTIFGKPAVMPGFWGNALGVIRLDLEYGKGAWQIKQSKAELRLTSSKDASGATVYVSPDPNIAPLVTQEHQDTIKYVNTPVGTSEFRITSFFSTTGDTAAMQLINAAQIDYVKTFVQNNLPQYSSLPILSAAAPFKMNFGGSGFTDIPAGGIAIKNIADLYLYPNTLQAVKISGETLKGWLEKSAQQFNTIDPAKADDQSLISSSFPSYNFDVIDGVTYQIDVTKPVGSRIVSLSYNNQPVLPSQEWIVVTNNYRASGGGGFPGLDGKSIIIESPDTNRDIIVSYVKKVGTLKRAKDGADRNWSFVPVAVAGKVTFESAYDAEAVARDEGITNVFKDSDKADKSVSFYRLQLAK